MSSEKVSFGRFYGEWHGHLESDLEKVLATAKADKKRVVYLAGDSSLDNKYWIQEVDHAVNGYQKILEPPQMKRDVS